MLILSVYYSLLSAAATSSSCGKAGAFCSLTFCVEEIRTFQFTGAAVGSVLKINQVQHICCDDTVVRIKMLIQEEKPAVKIRNIIPVILQDTGCSRKGIERNIFFPALK